MAAGRRIVIVKVGAIYPQTDLAGGPDALRRFMTAVEQMGFDYVLAYDHVVKATHDRTPKLWGPYSERDPFHDPFVLFSYAAAITTRLEFATGILILPQRQTVLVAQQAADVDLLSCERLRLGVGVGWNYVEYDALGQDFHTRGQRMDEQIGFLRQLWSTPVSSFKGRFDRIDRAGINPRPRRQIPIWIGGLTEPAFERAGRMGEGFIFSGGLAAALERWERVRFHLQDHSRPVADFGRELTVMQTGGAQQSAAELKTWRDSGGTHGCVRSLGLGLGADVEAHLDHLAQVHRWWDAG
jgi:probable F420-dependent oxidoreductase